jgi:hypothetical protein
MHIVADLILFGIMAKTMGALVGALLAWLITGSTTPLAVNIPYAQAFVSEVGFTAMLLLIGLTATGSPVCAVRARQQVSRVLSSDLCLV